MDGTSPAMAFVMWAMIALQFAWYAVVTVMLFRIWQRVKHLSG